MSTATVAFIRTLSDDQLEMYLSMLGATPATPEAAYVPTPENPTAVNEADVYEPIFVSETTLIGAPEASSRPAKAPKGMRTIVFQTLESMGLKGQNVMVVKDDAGEVIRTDDDLVRAYREALTQLGLTPKIAAETGHGNLKIIRDAKANAKRAFDIIDAA